MTFPIAESVGDLIYRNGSTGQNLQAVLEKEFEAVRSGYQGKAAAVKGNHGLTDNEAADLILLFSVVAVNPAMIMTVFVEENTREPAARNHVALPGRAGPRQLRRKGSRRRGMEFRKALENEVKGRNL